MRPAQSGLAYIVAAVVLSCSVSLCAAETAPTPEPLHVRIDLIVDGVSSGIAAPLVSDAEFLRRVSLDLVGVPPTTSELRDFLADATPNKRDIVIDRLINSPLFARQMADVFDIMLMERRPATQITADEWHNYLEESFRNNKPLNMLIREILTADGVDGPLRPAARFYLDRTGEPNLIARDVGRMFFGRDLQCAQCHDSPLVDDFLQSDYKGLYAFFEGGAVITKKEGDKDKSFYGERSAGDVAFESVFIKGKKHVTAARVPGDAELLEPVFYPGDEYTTPPADGVVSVPKFSRRFKLAELATNGTNRLFNENLANRLWAHMMGRGLVHPVDMNHSGNPATHPELLKLLGQEVAAMNFDAKTFLKELALSKVYQRSIDLPAHVVEGAASASERLAKLEQDRPPFAKSLEESQAAFDKAKASFDAAEAALLPAIDELNVARSKATEAEKKVVEATKAVAQVEASIKTKQDANVPLTEAIAKAQAASKQLPDEKDLAAVVQKLVERQTALTQAIAADQKGLEEKKAAVAPAEAERATARQGVDAAVAKVKPLRDPVHAADQSLVVARAKMMDDIAILGRYDERIHHLKELIKLKQAQDLLAVSTTEIQKAQSTVATARDAMADQAMAIAEQQSALVNAEQSQASAGAAMAEAAKEQATRAEVAKLLEQAYVAADAARQSMPANAQMTPIAEQLFAQSTQARQAVVMMTDDMNKASNQMSEAAKQLETARQSLHVALVENSKKFEGIKTAQQTLQVALAKSTEHQATEDVAEKELTTAWASDFTMAIMKPLTPEQMCWSLLSITGIYDRTKQAEAAEMDKTAPMSDEAKKDAAQVAARQRELEKRTYDKLKGNIGTFVAYFAAAGGQPQSDFFATADQALFVANGGTVNAWIAPAGGNITERLAQTSDLKQGAQDLYLSVLGRLPTDQEIADVTGFLAGRDKDKPVAAQELVWALVTSAEFRFNH